jgi:hypothetical protein
MLEKFKKGKGLRKEDHCPIAALEGLRSGGQNCPHFYPKGFS